MRLYQLIHFKEPVIAGSDGDGDDDDDDGDADGGHDVKEHGRTRRNTCVCWGLAKGLYENKSKEKQQKYKENHGARSYFFLSKFSGLSVSNWTLILLDKVHFIPSY